MEEKYLFVVMDHFPFLSLDNNLKIEIIKYYIEKKSYVSPFEKYISLLDGMCNFSLLCKELYNLLSTKRQLLINYFFNKPAAHTFKFWESQIWKQEDRILSFSCWKNYLISFEAIVYEYRDPDRKIILEADGLVILDDYLIDVKRDKTIIYESLEPIICHTVMGESLSNDFRQIDGDIFIDSFTGLQLFFSKNPQATRRLNSEILIKKNRSYYQGIEIPVLGEWELYFRKGNISVLNLVLSDYDIAMFLTIKENHILWIEAMRDDDLQYISNGFLITSRKIMDISSTIELKAELINLNKEGGYNAYYYPR